MWYKKIDSTLQEIAQIRPDAGNHKAIIIVHQRSNQFQSLIAISCAKNGANNARGGQVIRFIKEGKNGRGVEM
jgi:hypothetical protein